MYQDNRHYRLAVSYHQRWLAAKKDKDAAAASNARILRNDALRAAAEEMEERGATFAKLLNHLEREEES